LTSLTCLTSVSPKQFALLGAMTIGLKAIPGMKTSQAVGWAGGFLVLATVTDGTSLACLAGAPGCAREWRVIGKRTALAAGSYALTRWLESRRQRG
jgi:hypothetical protein